MGVFRSKKSLTDKIISTKTDFICFGELSDEELECGKIFRFSPSKENVQSQDGFLVAPNVLDLARVYPITVKRKFGRCLTGERVPYMHKMATEIVATDYIQVIEIFDYAKLKGRILEEVNSLSPTQKPEFFETLLLRQIREPKLLQNLFEMCYPEPTRSRVDYKKFLEVTNSPKMAKFFLENYLKKGFRENTMVSNLTQIILKTESERVAKLVFDALPRTGMLPRSLMNISHECLFPSVVAEAKTLLAELK